MSSSEAPTARPGSREIARAAVQAELSLAAYELVVEKGYGNVTLDDMAAAGGVSRSTFLRYFRTKDQAMLVALKAYVDRMADALRNRPREEDDWSALRNAIESFVVPIYRRNPAGAQAISRLALFTRALSGAHLERQDWRTPLTRALAERHGAPSRLRSAFPSRSPPRSTAWASPSRTGSPPTARSTWWTCSGRASPRSADRTPDGLAARCDLGPLRATMRPDISGYVGTGKNMKWP